MQDPSAQWKYRLEPSGDADWFNVIGDGEHCVCRLYVVGCPMVQIRKRHHGEYRVTNLPLLALLRDAERLML